MLNLYTSTALLKQHYPEYELVSSNDRYYMENIDTDTLDETDIASMKIIDKIELVINAKGEIIDIKSPFGRMLFGDISTGCKTAINLNNIIKTGAKVIISITECGSNAIQRCFEIADGTKAILLLQHNDFELPGKNYKYKLNGTIETSDIVDVYSYANKGDF